MADKTYYKITSEKGFYVGDICYALNDRIYDEVWGGAGYEDGIHEVPGTGRSFAVAQTAYGEGTYEDDYSSKKFDVDAGNIGLVPGELVEDYDGGHYFHGGGTALFTAEDGVFDITLPDGTEIHINTGDSAWDEEEEECWEEEEEEEDEGEEDGFWG